MRRAAQLRYPTRATMPPGDSQGERQPESDRARHDGGQVEFIIDGATDTFLAAEILTPGGDRLVGELRVSGLKIRPGEHGSVAVVVTLEGGALVPFKE